MSSGSTFCKRERLVSQKLMEMLFGEGSRSMASYPLRAVYMKVQRQEGAEPVQLLISVPKKRFRHAVDRNRVKRQIREAYRQHKAILHDALPATDSLLLALVWISNEHAETAAVEQRVTGLMRRISERL